jgi:DNA-binding IclR family transcriptional regulator
MANRRIKSTETIFSIIEAITQLDDPGLSDIAEDVDIAKSTTHKHLVSLTESEYVIKHESGYRLGLRFLEKGHQVKQSYDVLAPVVPILEELAEETGEAGWLQVEENGRAVNLHKEKGGRAVQTLTDIGQRIPMHLSAAGKCMLAHREHERVAAIVDEHGLEKRTEHTITNQQELQSELATVRNRGYAYDDREILNNVRAVGAPILVEETPVGGISISGPANRLQGDLFRDELPNLLLGAVNEIELRLEFDDNPPESIDIRRDA